MADNSDDTSTTSKEPVKVSPGSNILTYTPSDNVLMDYVSYTYNLSLIALSPDEYNKLILDKSNDPSAIYKPRNVIIAGAGRRDATMPRNENFNEDFYFDDFKMTTVIGMTTRTRMTNAIDISFTILEPYGVTLLNRLVNMANSPGLNCPNHVALPYLIQLEFYGYDEGGRASKIMNMTKYIPIKIIAMKIKVSTKGASYQVQAIPFNHTAYNDTTVHSPANFQVEATTIKDMFSYDDSLSNRDAIETRAAVEGQRQASQTIQEDAKNLSTLREEKKSLGGWEATARAPSLDKDITEAEDKLKASKEMAQSLSKRRIKIKSYVDGFNGWLQQQADMGLVSVANKIYVDFTDPEMRNSEIVFPVSTASTNAAMDHKKNSKNEATNVDETAKEGPKSEARGITIPAGTSTIDVITNAVLMSKYIREQFRDSWNDKLSKEDAEKLSIKLGRAVQWFKITPKVELNLAFDKRRGEYPVTVTYIVSPTSVFVSYNPQAPKGIPSGFAKYYFYMFTGQNTNVLDFDIDYDAAYYVKLTADKRNAQPNTTDEQYGSDKKENQEKENNKLIDKTVNNYVANLRPTIIYTAPPVDATDAKGVAAKDLANNIITSSKGDMIQLNLKILGDPDFIKQDDLFYQVTDASARESEHKTTNGSLIMDKGDIHAFVIFRTPVDYNGRGLAEPADDSKGTSYSTSIFSGIYKILTVESNFKSGLFTQTLTLIRLPNQQVTGLTEWMISKGLNEERTGKQDESLSGVSADQNVINAQPKLAGQVGSVEKNTASAMPGLSSSSSSYYEELSGSVNQTTSGAFNGVSFPGSAPNLSGLVKEVSTSVNGVVTDVTSVVEQKYNDVKNWATRMID